MSRRRRRSTGKIDLLPPHLKDAVEQMILNGVYYKDIVAYLNKYGVTLSQMSVCRYAGKYLATVEHLQLAQENFRMIAEEVDKYPELDTTEVILRIASQQVLNALTSAPAEAWEDVEPDKLLKNATALTRAVAYKRKTDLQNKTDQETALDANKTLLADLLGKKHPELLKQVMDALDQEQALLQQTEDGDGQ